MASETDGISPLADETIVKRLEGREVERAGGWEMGDSESNVRDGHFGEFTRGGCKFGDTGMRINLHGESIY